MKQLKVVHVPSIRELIVKSPGFEKKELANYKLDLMALCNYSCSYCSSTGGRYLRTNQKLFADLTEEQLGERIYPGQDPSLTFDWPDAIDKLRAQVTNKAPTWGAGKTLVFSMLTDGFSPLAVASGATKEALELVLAHTAFRVRVLTKNAVVGEPRWTSFFKAHPGRFVVGLSIGTLDDEWARRVEIGTSSPSARVRALRVLQDADVPTFGMLCPVFPEAAEKIGELIEAIRPTKCDHVWSEPYNDRANWRAVRDGYPEGSHGYRWMTAVYQDGEKSTWSEYATTLYQRLRAAGERDGWLDKLRYLLYEDGIGEEHAPAFEGLYGVLLQSKPGEDGASPNPWMAQIQRRVAPR